MPRFRTFTASGRRPVSKPVGNCGRKASGAASVIEYLESLNIRFYDGQGWSGSRRFVLTHHDPFRPDVPPDWILALPPEKRTNLSRAILEFADRHERGRILRHARRGNINGIENFLDILMSVSRMVFIYYTHSKKYFAAFTSIATVAMAIGLGGLKSLP
jgi:hypothetical protein